MKHIQSGCLLILVILVGIQEESLAFIGTKTPIETRRSSSSTHHQRSSLKVSRLDFLFWTTSWDMLFDHNLHENSMGSQMTIFSPSESVAVATNSPVADIPTLILIPGVFLLGAITAFILANTVYTPEITENAEKIRMEIREDEIDKLVEVIQENQKKGVDMEDLRRPLEVALDVKSLQEYIESVEEEDKQPPLLPQFCPADRRLARLLKSCYDASKKEDTTNKKNK